MIKLTGISTVEKLEQLVSEIMKCRNSKRNSKGISKLLVSLIGLISSLFPRYEKHLSTVLTCLYCKYTWPDNHQIDNIDAMMNDFYEQFILPCATKIPMTFEGEDFDLQSDPTPLESAIWDSYSFFKSLDVKVQEDVILASISAIHEYMNKEHMFYSYDLSVLKALNNRAHKRVE